MNASFDEQASSQSTNDQHSDTSSVNPQSPRSRPLNSCSNFNTNSNKPSNISNNNTQQHSAMQNQQQHYQNQDSFLYGSSGSVFHHPDIARNISAHHQRPSSTLSLHSNNNSNNNNNYSIRTASSNKCTGVDKLIMAAMMEESAAAAVAAATGNTGYMPSGRGIGYFGNSARETFTHIPTPNNKSELELYRLLEHANLLNYFGTFLNFGGDDVQQLSDADEDEFLEIMSLVGMTQKPLHVRRLQKALIDWKENKEFEQNFRRPSQTSTINQQMPANYSLQRQQQIPTTPISFDSPALTCTSSVSRASITKDNYTTQTYVLPHEILIGAPKRLKLMDDLHKRDRYSSQEVSPTKPEASPIKRNYPDKINEKNSFVEQLQPMQQLTSSPKSQRSCHEDERFIEVIDSPCSDVGEPEEEAEVSRASCGTPSDSSAKISHSKYGRYRASLNKQSSPNKLAS